MSKMIFKWRGSMRPNISTGQVSKASCISVWLVYEKTP